MTQTRQGVPSLTAPRRGLGRGLGALIPTAPTGETSRAAGRGRQRDQNGSAVSTADSVAGAWFAELPVGSIVPNPRQPRQVFDPDALGELVASLKEVGLLQPVVVREVAADRYELIMGERRWRAAQLAGFAAVPAIVRATEDAEMLIDALLENLHRAELNPLEEAAAYDQLLKDFECTHDVLAARIGRSRSQVSNTVRLLKLPPAVQRRVAAGVLSAGHARALLAVERPEEQERLAARIVEEGLSVRTAEELAAVGDSAREPRPRRTAGRRPEPPTVAAIEAALADRLDTRVKVQLGSNRGRVVVEFASVEDLERIVGLILPSQRVTASAARG